jgi:hypothetical protein
MKRSADGYSFYVENQIIYPDVKIDIDFSSLKNLLKV